MLNQLYFALDPASRLTIKRIGVTLAVSLLLSLFAKPGFRLSFFVGLAGLAVFVSGIMAMRARQRFNAPELNHWDEMAFFSLVTVLLLPLAST